MNKSSPSNKNKTFCLNLEEEKNWKKAQPASVTLNTAT